MNRKALEIAVALLAFAVLFEASRGVEGLSRRKHDLEVLYLPSGRFLEQATLGYHDLAADVLWFKTVQYYGGYRMGQNDLALFTHLVGVITDLDPQFVFAYVFGALIIAQDLGHLDEGVAFLEKGMRNNPSDWWLPFELGFLYFVGGRDCARAMSYFEKASRLPGAQPIAARFAAFAAAKAGYRETSIAMWEELARESDNRYIRELAERYIAELKAGTFGRSPGKDEK
jgi:tetratricopeptide (TPR) repeat protein